MTQRRHARRAYAYSLLHSNARLDVQDWRERCRGTRYVIIGGIHGEEIGPAVSCRETSIQGLPEYRLNALTDYDRLEIYRA